MMGKKQISVFSFRPKLHQVGAITGMQASPKDILYFSFKILPYKQYSLTYKDCLSQNNYRFSKKRHNFARQSHSFTNGNLSMKIERQVYHLIFVLIIYLYCMLCSGYSKKDIVLNDCFSEIQKIRYYIRCLSLQKIYLYSIIFLRKTCSDLYFAGLKTLYL